MASFSPRMAFRRVDFPAFGFPKILTKPARCIIIKFNSLNGLGDVIPGSSAAKVAQIKKAEAVRQDSIDGAFLRISVRVALMFIKK